MPLTWNNALQFVVALLFLACGLAVGRRKKLVMASFLVASFLIGAIGLMGLLSTGSMSLDERQDVLDRSERAIERIRKELGQGKPRPERLVEINREIQILRETLKNLK